MKTVILVTVCLVLGVVKTETVGNCQDNEESKGIEECSATEYQSYVECVRRRMKRQTSNCNRSTNCSDCEDSCQQCDCDFCAVNICDSNCDSCCPENPPCKNKRCCHKTCHSRCKTIPCRTDCRRNCIEKVTASPEIVETNNATVIAARPQHNVTTIIELHNIINNTNEIQIPINLNNTNYNNFTLSDSTHTQVPNTNPDATEPCCQIISPRQCMPKQEYPFVKCFQLRKKACGNICQAPTLLEQWHEVCEKSDNGTTCHQEPIYVPYTQPNCNFQPTWPYIQCGLPQYPYGPQPIPLPIQFPASGCPTGNCYNDIYNLGSYGMAPFYGQTPVQIPYAAFINNYSGLLGNSANPIVIPGNAASAPNDSTAYVNKKEISLNPVIPTENLNTYSYPNQYPYPYQYPIQYQYQYPYQSPYSYPPQTIPQWQPYYPVQMTPLGYPYGSQPPVYYLPPEVDIQASVSNPEKNGRYAQITITDKRETDTNTSTLENLGNAADVVDDTKNIPEGEQTS